MFPADSEMYGDTRGITHVLGVRGYPLGYLGPRVLGHRSVLATSEQIADSVAPLKRADAAGTRATQSQAVPYFSWWCVSASGATMPAGVGA